MRMRTVAARAGVAASAAAAPPVTWWLCEPTLVALRASTAQGSARDVVELDLMLSALASAVLGLAVLWLAAVVLGTAVEAVTGRSCGVVHRTTPDLLRRGLLTAFGVAVGTGTALGPAVAATSPLLPPPTHGGAPVGGAPVGAEPPGPRATTCASAAPDNEPDIAGLRLPDRPVGGSKSRSTAWPPHPAARPPADEKHRVRSGESLWSIAADRMRPDAPPARVDEAWRVLYRVNRDVVGPDPNLIHPTTVLRLPSTFPPPAGPSPRDRPRP